MSEFGLTFDQDPTLRSSLRTDVFRTSASIVLKIQERSSFASIVKLNDVDVTVLGFLQNYRYLSFAFNCHDLQTCAVNCS